MEIMPKAHPQVIVSDVTMPLMDGIEMVRRVKATPGFEQVPLVSCPCVVPTVPVAAVLRKHLRQHSRRPQLTDPLAYPPP
jgi:CheY-like chemotaxis protein